MNSPESRPGKQHSGPGAPLSRKVGNAIELYRRNWSRKAVRQDQFLRAFSNQGGTAGETSRPGVG
jgi:hypothetical protein